ncbi:putative lipoprotein [Mycobacterium kansasii 732]|uniref:Uncharacterized protein n=2 Tax=Mycobacterium TaxID=1763 RepID=A0A498QM12_9MYCO|nr:putative lipoprotein [Mycobacterium kansasii 732]EUA21774.1 putative lipoprotein [Mycobacterium kansasii 662]VAZ90098.1 hypothetical protein LAUMK35_01156 [Mycobacterium pseudokansasii]VAZ90838.1 hypothetical protein LAUMK21_01156 [Mycobacterium pseudokansasii]VBA48001.1 hypothetical protein LAUMK142_01039 [Mycobacterium pseudokansasii]
MSPVLLRYHVTAVALSVALAGCAGSRPVSQPAPTFGYRADATPGLSAMSAPPATQRISSSTPATSPTCPLSTSSIR